MATPASPRPGNPGQRTPVAGGYLLRKQDAVMDPKTLRARAARYRQLARDITDEQTTEGLLALAAELEQRAAEAEAPDPPEANQE